MLNKVSNLLMLVQILMLNTLAVAVGVSIYPQSKIVAIILLITVIALFFLKELKFFNLLNVWHSSLKKELRCTPLFDLCFIIVFIYYYGYEDFSFFVVPVVVFFAIDIARNFLEKKISSQTFTE